MNRPAGRQWAVLWLGVIWIVVTLAIAEDYVVRGVFAAIIVTGLLFWQLAPRQRAQPLEAGKAGGEPESVDNGPVGLGGWLALFIVGLALLPIATLTEIIDSASNTVDRWQFGGELLAMVTVCVSALIVLASILSKSSNAPRLTKWLLFALALLTAFGVFATADDADTFSYTVGRSLPTFVWAIVWGLYFERSRRVKNTFFSSPNLEHKKRNQLAAISISLITVALLWFGVFAFERAERRFTERYKNLTFYDVLRSSLANDAAFVRGFTNGVKKRLQSGIQNSTVTITQDAVLDDLQFAYRAVVGYAVEVAGDANSVTRFDGEVRSYFHPDGLVVIEGFCDPEELECSGMSKLYEHAEKNILARLSGSQLTGILPDGECSIESVDLPEGPAQTVQCYYSETRSAFLSIVRHSKEQTLRAFQDRLPTDSKSKREIVRRVTAMD